MEERHSTQNKRELHKLDPVIIPSGTIFSRDGDVTGTPIVMGFKVVDTGVLGDVLAEEFGDAGA